MVNAGPRGLLHLLKTQIYNKKQLELVAVKCPAPLLLLPTSKSSVYSCSQTNSPNEDVETSWCLIPLMVIEVLSW